VSLLQFSRNFFVQVSLARLPLLASAARCSPQPCTPLATPLVSARITVRFSHSRERHLSYVHAWPRRQFVIISIDLRDFHFSCHNAFFTISLILHTTFPTPSRKSLTLVVYTRNWCSVVEITTRIRIRCFGAYFWLQKPTHTCVVYQVSEWVEFNAPPDKL